MSKHEDIAKALETIKGNWKEFQDYAKDIELMKSALESTTSMRMTETIKDLWTEGATGRASREQIKVGPGQSASGDGAERMIREYSSPAMQHGIQLMAESLARMVGPMVKSLEATTAVMDVLKAQQTSIDTLAAATMTLVKKAEEDEDEEEDNESKVVNIGKAKMVDAVKKAEADIGEANGMIAKAAGMKPKAKARVTAEADTIRKAATATIMKAHAFATVFDDADLLKTVKMVAMKADVEVVQEEEEEDDEEEASKSLAITALQKAIDDPANAAIKASLTEALEKAKGADARGNQADRKGESGNQAAEAVKSAQEAAITEIGKKVSDAITGLGMLQTTVKGLLDTVGGQSKHGMGLPALEIVKSVTGRDKLADLNSKIEKAENAGTLNRLEAAEAFEVVRNFDLVAQGFRDRAFAESRLEKSSQTVRTLISDELKAAA